MFVIWKQGSRAFVQYLFAFAFAFTFAFISSDVIAYTASYFVLIMAVVMEIDGYNA